ncbi:uncharacterized protein LOC117120835 [Anneissia japonica]|uniref:uncharacterized protein LOC117120835 n=1 Tax=Anneissia japonica TaxID=1529436 RepID=UPI0014257151|nr:uncharacterized protein LOC117120835 [Anneissia japonica]
MKTIICIGLVIFNYFVITECIVFINLGSQDLRVTQGNRLLLYCRAPEINTLKVFLGRQGNVHLSLSDTTWSRFMFMWNGINKGFGLIPTSRRETQCQYLVRFIRSIVGTNSVTVLSAPNAGSPSCTMDTPKSHVHVGQTIELTCTSHGGNPPAELQWFSRGRPLTSIAIRKTTITHLLDENDNGVIFTCSARSPAMDRPRSCSLQPLHIQPTVQVTPVTNLVQVEESAMFRCKGDGVPGIGSYQWYFGDQLITTTTGRIRRLGRELHIDEVLWRDHNIIVRCVVATINGLKANASGVIRVVYDLEPTALHAQPNEGDGYFFPPMRTDRPSTKSVNNLVVLIGLGIAGLLFGAGTIMTYIVYVKISNNRNKKRLESSRFRGGRFDKQAQTSARHHKTKSVVSISSKTDDVSKVQCAVKTTKKESRSQSFTSCRLERVPSEAYKKNNDLSAISEEPTLSYEPINHPDDAESDYYDFSGEYFPGIDYDDVSLNSQHSHTGTNDDMDGFYEPLRPSSDLLDDKDIAAIIEAAMRRTSLTRNGDIFYAGSKSWAL